MGVRTFIKDNWANIQKGFGSAKDSNTKNEFGDFRVISDFELASMYAGDGWMKKVATVPAGTMVREWISISDDASGSIAASLDKLDAQNLFKEAITWQRVFRGGLIWMVSDKPSTHNFKATDKQNIKKLLVFSASEVRINEIYSYENTVEAGSQVTKKKVDPLQIGEVKTFKILKNRKRSEDIIVDASQCLVFKGEALPSVPHESFDALFSGTPIDILEYEYWGMGIFQSIFPQMSKYGVFEGAMGKIATELVVGIYKIAGLREILSSDGGPDLIRKRVEAIDLAKSTINALFMDAEGGEEFARNTIQLAGVPDLWDRFMMTASGVTNIPASKLFGRQASGLNNKGEQDERNYNDYISEEQGKDMKRNLQILLRALTGNDVPFTFNNPWAPSQAELIEMRERQSKIDDVYLNRQVLSPDEVRNSRFDGNYSFETELSRMPPESAPGDEGLPE